MRLFTNLLMAQPMRRTYALLFFFFFICSANAQQTTIPAIEFFELDPTRKANPEVVENATFLKVQQPTVDAFIANAPREFTMEIPTADGAAMVVELEQYDILTPDFKVSTSSGKRVSYEQGLFYIGKVVNNREESTATLSITGNELMGMFTLGTESFVLGKMDTPGRIATEYVIYKDDELVIAPTHECFTAEAHHINDEPMPDVEANPVMMGSNVVEIYFECDYAMYQGLNSNINDVVDYTTGLFNMVSTIYHEENIVMQISEIMVWDTPDNYSAGGNVLGAFSSAMAGGFNGDLAHLLSFEWAFGGGIAYVDVLCWGNDQYKTGVSNLYTSYEQFPLYSWSVMVVTHELGHNLGSPHTHDCVWGAGNDSALDDCYTPGGSCGSGPTPTNGGTIMSYCHLVGGVGINLNNGFGYEPGNLIRSRVSGAACLSAAMLDCSDPIEINCGQTISGNTNDGINNVNTYGCIGWNETGPEQVYMLTTTERSTISATISDAGADLDVFILEVCSETSCVAYGNAIATLADANAGMYMIVVDGRNGAAGSYSLTVSCDGYCFTNGSTYFEYIDEVEIGDYVNNTGSNYGYAIFENTDAKFQQGEALPITLTPGFNFGAYNQYWRVYVDFNQDGYFNGVGELAFDAGSASYTAVTGMLNIPASAALGKTRMRVVMNYSYAADACGDIGSGEVEDYEIEIICPSTGNTYYEYIDQVNINGINNASGNDNGYGDYSFVTIFANQGDALPVTLTPGYNFGSYEEYWAIWIDYNQDNVFDPFLELVFDGSAIGATSGTITIPTAAPVGTYKMRVAMQFGVAPQPCNTFYYGETEDYTIDISSLSPLADGTDEEVTNRSVATTTPDIEPIAAIDSESTAITLFPSPAIEVVNIDWNGTIAKSVMVFDANGQPVVQEQLEEVPNQLNVNQLVAGIYFVQIITQDGDLVTKRFIKI